MRVVRKIKYFRRRTEFGIIGPGQDSTHHFIVAFVDDKNVKSAEHYSVMAKTPEFDDKGNILKVEEYEVFELQQTHEQRNVYDSRPIKNDEVNKKIQALLRTILDLA